MKYLDEKHIAQIRSDCLYASLLHRLEGRADLGELLFSAGNIVEDRTAVDEAAIRDVKFLTMPLSQLIFEGSKPQALIVTTGSFSPIHAGHIDIMVRAKRHLEAKGYEVIRGVVSASHDAYVDFKRGGSAKMHIAKRAQKIHEAIRDEDWLIYDSFEGEGVSCALNFSTVIERIRAYFLHHYTMLSRSLKVFYVFGSDNQGFCEAFVGSGEYGAICVERSGYECDSSMKKYSAEASIHFLEKSDDTGHLSSTSIRELGFSDCPQQTVSRGIYLIRNDAVSDDFAKELLAQFQSTMVGVAFRPVCSADFKTIHGDAISLDKFVPGVFTLDISRIFDLCSGQLSAKGLGSTYDSIEAQISAISPGEYTLLDDDSVSGYTMAHVEKLLIKRDIHIKGRETLISEVLGADETLYDIVDARDFMVGAYKGGLAVDIKGRVARVPYLFPFVNLTSRASLAPEHCLSFSKALWLMNKAHVGDVRISDLDDIQSKVFKEMGLADLTIGEICDYFVKFIDNAQGEE